MLMLTLLGQEAWGQAPATQPRGQTDPIVVTAPYPPLRDADFSVLPPRDLLRQPLVESPGLAASTSVVGRKEIELFHAESIVDAAQFVPGVWTETRGRKVKQFLSVRGQNYPYPSYDIDGAWFRDFDDTSYFFHAANVERLELVRSAGTLLLSPGDIAGVVNIVPRTYAATETHFSAVYGSEQTARGQFSHGGPAGDFSYSLGAGFRHTDGPEGRDGQENIANLYARLAYAPSESVTVSLALFGMNGERDFQLAKPPATVKLRTTHEGFDPLSMVLAVAKVHLQTSDTASTEVIANGAYRQAEHYQSGTPNNTERDYEYGLRVVQSLQLCEGNTLRASAFFNHWESPTGKRFFAGNEADLWTYSVALIDEHRLDRWTFNLGYRLSQTYYDAFGGFNVQGTAGALGVVEVRQEWEEPLHTFSAGAAYDLAEDLTLLGNVTWGMVAPPPGVLDADFKAPATETQTKLDLGVRKQWEQTLEATLTGFVVHQVNAAVLSNAVVTVNGDDFALHTAADRVNYGLEAEVRSSRLECGLQFFANVVAMQTQRTAADGDWSRDQAVPQVIIGAGASWVIDRVELGATAKFISAYENNRFLPGGSPPAPLGDATEVTLTASYYLDAGQRSRVWVSLENLLNDRFSTVAGYPDAGRQVFAGVELAY